MKKTDKSWEDLSLGTAVRLNQQYEWGITTTLSHVTTALEKIHSSCSSVAGRYKTATSEKVQAFRAERATEEVLNEWQILSSRIRRLTIPFSVGM